MKQQIQFNCKEFDYGPEDLFAVAPVGLLEKIKGNEKLQIAIAAGCEIVTEQKEEEREDGSMSMSVTMKTKYPVSIRLSADGKLQVFELRSKNQIVQKSLAE